jgi:hypothetical protein
MSSAQALLGAVAGRFSVSRSEGMRTYTPLGGLTKADWAEGKRGLD